MITVITFNFHRIDNDSDGISFLPNGDNMFTMDENQETELYKCTE